MGKAWVDEEHMCQNVQKTFGKKYTNGFLKSLWDKSYPEISMAGLLGPSLAAMG